MTVETTDYTPGGISLCYCRNEQLLETMHAILSHGMLRGHAQDRLMNRVIQEIDSRGYGWYEYGDTDPDPWVKEVGLVWGIVKGGELTTDEDYHECIACENRGHDVFHVFPVRGPLTEKVKRDISEHMIKLVAKAKIERDKWRAKQAEMPEFKGAITGMMRWPL